MAWTDLTNEDPNSWTLVREIADVTDVKLDTNSLQLLSVAAAYYSQGLDESVARLSTLNVPGFDDGYQPNYVPNPIANNIDQPDPDAGTGEWPESRFLYPRGY